MNRPKKSKFPIFLNGDVEIILSRKPEDRFVLHSVVLGLHFPFFKTSISERWSGQNHETLSSDPIKWRYSLLFDDEGLDEYVPLLVKAKADISDISGQPDVSPDTASILLVDAPYVPSDDSETESRLAYIRSHRWFLEVLYNKPLDVSASDFTVFLHRVASVLVLAEVYGSLAIFHAPVVAAFDQRKRDLIRSYDNYYYVIISIAMRARHAWLFKQAICRLIGDPTWADDKISERFETLGIATFVLKKREQLREKMVRLDKELLLSKLPDEGFENANPLAIALATAALRNHIIRHISFHDKGEWKLSSRKYRILEGDREPWSSPRYTDLLGPFTHVRFNVATFEKVFKWFRENTATAVKESLLVSHVDKEHSIGNVHGPKYWDQGLTCMEITDDDLPWKDIPW